MRLFKRKNMWYGDYTRYNKRIREPLNSDKRVAEQILREKLVNIDKNNAGIPTDINIGKLIDEYLNHSKATKKESTYERDKICLKEFKTMINLGSKLSQIAQGIGRLLDDYKARKLNAGGNPFTINIFIRTVKALLNQAFKWKYLNSNPLAGFKIVRVGNEPRIRFLTDEEISNILGLCDQELKDVILTFIYSGLRAGELLFLEWEDVDFERNVIKVQEKDIWTPKTYERREIPISPVLKRLLLRRKLISSNCFVFCKSSGDREAEKKKRKPTQGSSYRILFRKYKNILLQLGIEDVGLHTLRHTFGSRCAMSGIDLPTLAKMMGHSSIKTTMIYVHISTEHMQNSILKLYYDIKEIANKIAMKISGKQLKSA